MTDLPFDVSETLDAFECPESIQVYEKSGSYVDGYWTETSGEPRTLNCILLNVDEQKMEIVAQGRNVDAAYCIMFPDGVDTLYYTTQQDSTVQNKQTYAIIDGMEFVVVNNTETVKNAGFKSYYALRYKDGTNKPEVENA